MSVGGKESTTTTPNIPPELRSLLDARTGTITSNVPDASNLFKAAETGDRAALSKYTSAGLPAAELVGQGRRNVILEAAGSRGQGGQLDQALASNELATTGARAQGESAFAGDLIAELFRLVGGESYPVGGTRSTITSPGVLDYLNALANASQGLGGYGRYSPGQQQEQRALSYPQYGPQGGAYGGESPARPSGPDYPIP